MMFKENIYSILYMAKKREKILPNQFRLCLLRNAFLKCIKMVIQCISGAALALSSSRGGGRRKSKEDKKLSSLAGLGLCQPSAPGPPASPSYVLVVQNIGPTFNLKTHRIVVLKLPSFQLSYFLAKFLSKKMINAFFINIGFHL